MQLSLGGFEEALQLPKNIGVTQHAFGKTKVAIHEGEFWTSKQRDGHSIHEVSYRACYKPQLPEYFIKRHAAPGSVVFDPFLGRGTTLIEARMHGCRTIGSDINPLSVRLAGPRLYPSTLEQVKDRLNSVVLNPTNTAPVGLLEFFHPDTLQEIQGWMAYFQQRRELDLMDRVDEWIEMVAANRLTGHSNGFFSVYTLPPNQAVSIERQKKINAKLKQRPEYRNTRLLVLKKTRSLLRDALPDGYGNHTPKLFHASADSIPQVASNSVDLVVTSPPFQSHGLRGFTQIKAPIVGNRAFSRRRSFQAFNSVQKMAVHVVSTVSGGFPQELMLTQCAASANSTRHTIQQKRDKLGLL